MTAMPPNPPPSRRVRATPLSARGEPMVWLTGTALSICLFMILALLGIVVYQGSRTFWPRPIDRVTLVSGELFLGVPIRDEAYDPGEVDRQAIQAARLAGTLDPMAAGPDGRPIRRLYRVGNRELLGQPFRWVPLHEIAELSRDPDAVFVERQAWGVWVGMPDAVLRQDIRSLPGPASGIVASETIQTADGPREIERVVLREEADGSVVVRERTILARGPEETMAVFGDLFPEAVERRERVERIKQRDIGAINALIEKERLRLREAEMRHTGAGRRASALPPAVFFAVLLATGGALVAAGIVTRRLVRGHADGPPSTRLRAGITALWLLVAVGGLGLWLENPWATRAITAEQYQEAQRVHDERLVELDERYRRLQDQIREIETEDSRDRVVFVQPSDGRFAPLRQTEQDEPMLVSQVIRVVQTNRLSWIGRLGVYVDRWREFLFDDPREQNTEGGVYPVIFGTVLLTLLLSVAVVPLGIVAALYLREYAKQGVVTSFVRIAVNNLAGVPSIVYGVFGLGFFCYTLGRYVDAGPRQSVGGGAWWLMVVASVAVVVAAVALSSWARPRPGQAATTLQRRAAGAAMALWLLCSLLAVALIAFTPYFGGFFAAKLPAPTFGTKGLLWASLTLALLTLPVVIVATEEAIAAVPRSMREGSYGCGASKWQTIQRIVLPRAMPGVMTGMILAMARGAGEVAPLMLVGAVKLAPELLITSEFPFLHLNRSFMHLGFHIYDVGFQSPDSEAARPLVWCTTLLLIVIVLLLNATAIRIRSGLRRKFMGEAF